MTAKMTNKINKGLDKNYNNKRPNFNLKDIKLDIQIRLARKKNSALETITLGHFSTPVEAF